MGCLGVSVLRQKIIGETLPTNSHSDVYTSDDSVIVTSPARECEPALIKFSNVDPDRIPSASPQPIPTSASPPPPCRGQRQRNAPVRYAFSAKTSVASPSGLHQVPDPSLFKEAMLCPDREKWMAAQACQLAALR